MNNTMKNASNLLLLLVVNCIMVIIGPSTVGAFSLYNHPSQQLLQCPQQKASSTRLFGIINVNLNTISDIGYIVSVEKPIGVVFGENRIPFLGLSVDNVENDSHGDIAGLKIGDQLIAINNKSVVGYEFDKAISLIKDASSPVELQLYRGTVKSLYTIVMNRRGSDENDDTNEIDNDDFDEESDVTDDDIVFDENYESPVIMSVDEFEDDTISVSQVANDAVKNIGNALSPKTIGGFFGKMFTQETIQLEDKDGK
jgi:hypothetical protein